MSLYQDLYFILEQVPSKGQYWKGNGPVIMMMISSLFHTFLCRSSDKKSKKRVNYQRKGPAGSPLFPAGMKCKEFPEYRAGCRGSNWIKQKIKMCYISQCTRL